MDSVFIFLGNVEFLLEESVVEVITLFESLIALKGLSTIGSDEAIILTKSSLCGAEERLGVEVAGVEGSPVEFDVITLGDVEEFVGM